MGHNYYVEGGRIRSWKCGFECVTPGCHDLVLPGEGGWSQDVVHESDPPGEQVFDPDWLLVMPLDTLCTTTACPGSDMHVKLDFRSSGEYLFTIQGRDTDALNQTCWDPWDLDPNFNVRPISISDLGLTSQVVSRSVIWRQLADVRAPRRSGDAIPAWARRSAPLLH